MYDVLKRGDDFTIRNVVTTGIATTTTAGKATVSTDSHYFSIH